MDCINCVAAQQRPHALSATLPSTYVAMSASSPTAAYDRTVELRALDDTASGVRGLVASGITRVPRIFRVPDDHRQEANGPPADGQEATTTMVPLIDLGAAVDRRASVVAAISAAASEWGFFQVTGHGVPDEAMDAAVEATRAFHEAADGGEVKAKLYSRDPARAVKYNCNFDLYQSEVANWRDTLYLRLAPNPPAPGELPEYCRDALFDLAGHVKDLRDTLFELLSEALGLDPGHLAGMGCNEGHMMLCHYYPPCPEPEVAVGTTRHSDSGFLTVLLQDAAGGLQVLHGDRWIDVTPVPGAMVVNVGDLLQMVSNDRFRSVEHRVVVGGKGTAARVSIACFPSDPASERVYGPIRELVSDECPPLYRETLAGDYVAHYYSVGLGPKMAIHHFRI